MTPGLCRRNTLYLFIVFLLVGSISYGSDRPLTRLSLEVTEAIDNDPMYGPRHDRERNVIGAEYELLLEESLRKMGERATQLLCPLEVVSQGSVAYTSNRTVLLPIFLTDIPFETENELRERGTARTPDVLLSCPVGIEVPKKNGDGSEWKVVCWIDSKVGLFFTCLYCCCGFY